LVWISKIFRVDNRHALASVHVHKFFLITMANTRSAAKRARQTMKRSLRNRSVVTGLRTMQKTVRSAQTPSPEQIRALVSAIDKAAKRGIIHENAANRRKARLNKALAGAK
jgi:small subunit ribosomal protein S20